MARKFPFNVSTFDHFRGNHKHGRPASTTPHSLVVEKEAVRGNVDWVEPVVIGALGTLSLVLILVIAKQNPDLFKRFGRFCCRIFGEILSKLGRQPDDDGGEQYEMPDAPAVPSSDRPLTNRTDSDRLRRCSRV